MYLKPPKEGEKHSVRRVIHGQHIAHENVSRTSRRMEDKFIKGNKHVRKSIDAKEFSGVKKKVSAVNSALKKAMSD